jgi:hypothetical protein
VIGLNEKRQMNMKQMSVGEKFDLIRYHGQSLMQTGHSIPASRKSDVIESAERIVELAKSIPKDHWGIED